MEPQINFDLNQIKNIDNILKSQVAKLNQIRELVRGLKFIPVDQIGTYSSVTYKSK